MKTNEKLRELAEMYLRDEIKIDRISPIQYEGIMRALENVISEHYYPKEFVEWMMIGGHIGIHDRKGYLYSSSLLNLSGFKGDNTIDELFNYWKENERWEK